MDIKFKKENNNYLVLKHGQCQNYTSNIKELLYYINIKQITCGLADFLINNELESVYKDLKYSEDSKDYFSFSGTDDTKISYLKGDRIPEDSTLIWDQEYRKDKAYHTKIGKLLSNNVSQKDIQTVSALLSNRGLKNTKIFLSSDIKKYYHEDNYSNIMGTQGNLGSSCMRYDHLQEAIGLYENMGNDTVQLLVLTDHEDRVLARGLFWKNVKYNNEHFPENTEYLDRVYAVNDNIEHILYEYAKDKNIPYYRDRKGTVSISINIDEDVSVPYFDTFQGYSHGCLSSMHGDYSLDKVEGETLEDCDENNCICGDCGERFDTEHEGGYSEDSGDHYCSDCGTWVDDYFYINSDTVYSEHDGVTYLQSDENIVYCEYINDYVHMDYTVFSEYHGSHLLSNDSVYVESEEDWYLKEDDCIIYNSETNEYEIKKEVETNV